MSAQCDASTMLDLMAQNEHGISLLYSAYAGKLPEWESFWSDLAEEESEHSRWIQEFATRVRDGSVGLARDRFKEEAVRSFQTHVKGELERVDHEEVPIVTALSVATDIERALIERKGFEVFDSDSEELRRLLCELTSATEDHRRRIEQAWSEQRKHLE
jgi:hypothetical protein